jgi:hypothetical protein
MLGFTVTDKITGFKGIVVGYVNYLTGCSQALVQPRIKADGSPNESLWLDVQKLEIDDSVSRVILENGATPGFDKAPPVR